MNMCLFAFLGMWETIAILAVVMLIFGAKKMPEMMRGMGQGIKEFKKASKEANEDLYRSLEKEKREEQSPPPPPSKEA